MLIGSIDQGTQSSRFIAYDQKDLNVVRAHQSTPLKQVYPRPGWVEQDPEEIWSSVVSSVEGCVAALVGTGADAPTSSPRTRPKASPIGAIGIANQRETTILWDSETGLPLYNAIVWNDDRTSELCEGLAEELGGVDVFREVTGLPISTYFSAYKIRWMIENSKVVSDAVNAKRCMFGTVDSWLVYKLTRRKRHCIDVTNASRTGLMDLRSLAWSALIVNKLKLDGVILPEIVSSAESLGVVSGIDCLQGAEITGCLGDQQASMLGHQLKPTHVKSTYGTGCFVLMNTGSDVVKSSHGLLSTVAFKLGPESPAMYALEGAIGTAGQGISWLRDSLEVLESSEDSERVASLADTCQGVLFVPAFSGLLAPFWSPDARAAILGMTYATKKSHIVRAMLAAICFQTRAVLDAMATDYADFASAETPIDRIVVDGGASSNNLLMQMQANVLGTRIARASSSETTALGAAVAAGVGAGLWTGARALSMLDSSDRDDDFIPYCEEAEVQRHYEAWSKAVNLISRAGTDLAGGSGV
jgi:glycerol kinase